MAISVSCKKCGESYRVKDDKAGTRIRCKGCAAAISVPAGDDEEFDLDGEAEPEKPARGAKGRKKAAGKAKPSGSNKLVLIIAGGVAGVALIAGLVFMLLSGGDKPNAAPVAEQSTTPAMTEPAAMMPPVAPPGEAHAAMPVADATPMPMPMPMPAVAAAVATTPVVAAAPNVPVGPMLSLEDPQLWTDLGRARQQLRDIALAFHTYLGVNNSLVPDPNLIPALYAPDGRLKLSWRVHLLPALGQVELFNKFNIGEAWDSPTNRPLVDQIPDVFRSPGATGGNTRVMGFSARGVSGTNGLRPVSSIPIGGPIALQDVTDGTVNTALVVLAPIEKAVPWTSPEDVPFDPQQPEAALGFVKSNSPVLLMAMMDGRVAAYPSNLSPDEFGQLVHVADGNVLSLAEVPFQDPWRFAKPKPGPLALAYLTDDCIAVVTLQPSKILATDWVKKLLPPETVKAVFRDAAIDPHEVDQLVIWFLSDNLRSVAFGVTLSKPVSPETHPKLYANGRAIFFAHDDRTLIDGPPEGVNAVTAPTSLSGSTPNILRERLGSGESAQEGRAIINMQHPAIAKILSGKSPAGPPNLAASVMLAQFQKTAFAQSQAIEVLLTPSAPTLLEIKATAPDEALKGQLNTAFTELLTSLKLGSGQLPNGDAVRDILKDVAVTQEGLSVSLALKKSDTLLTRLGELLKPVLANIGKGPQ